MRTRNPAERFFEKVRFTDCCWEWRANKNWRGYGQFQLDGTKNTSAHRWAYEFCMGAIPAGLQIDHLCRNRACVNPDHLEPVTQRVNLMRGEGITARNASKTHCPYGHEYNGENTYLSPAGKRHCKACKSRLMRQWRERRGNRA